jgi:uncharacterized membrane protein
MNADREESAGARLAALIEQEPQVLEDGLVLRRTADMPAPNVAAVFFGTDASGVSTAVVLFADPPSGAAIEDVLTGLHWPAAETDAGLGGGKRVGRRRVILLARDFYEGFARALARATGKQTRVEASRVLYRSLPGGEHALAAQPLRPEGADGLRLAAVTDDARYALRFLSAPRKAPDWLDRVRRGPRRVLDSIEARGISRKAVAYIVLACMMAAYAWVFGLLSLQRHNTFGTFAYDLGEFDQAVWLLSHGKYAFDTIRGLYIFGDHVCLTILALAPFYWFWSDARVLLIAQTLFLALGALPLYWIAKDKLKGSWIALLFPFLYLMYPALQWTNWDEYHPDTLATPMLLFAFYFLTRKKYIPFTLCAAIVLLTKEDFAFTVAALGIYAFLTYDRKWGAALVAGSAAWFLVATRVILVHFNGVGLLHVNVYGALGSSWQEVAMAFLTKPGLIFKSIATPGKLLYLTQLLAPVAFLSLLAPSVLAICLPAVVINLLAGPYQSMLIYHYTVLITPFVFVALVNAFAKVEPTSYAKYLAVGTLLVVALVANAAWSPSPLSGNVGFWGVYTPRIATLEEAISHLPKDASVSATYAFVPHVDHRQYVYLWPNPFEKIYWGLGEKSPLPDPRTVQYVLLDETVLDAHGKSIESSLTSSGQFAPVFSRDNVVLLRRR